MNDSELARLMLEWEELEHQQKIIEETVAKEVLERGETFVVGNVRATLSNPRKSYKYEEAVNKSLGEYSAEREKAVDKHSKLIVDWRGICKDYDIGDIPYTVSGEPKVTLKVK